MKRLDTMDFKILELLKERGAVSPNATYIAKKLKKPIATVHGRLRRLEGKGVIERYVPLVSSKETGVDIQGFVFLQAQAGADFNEYGKKLSKLEEITEVYYLVGQWGFMCRVRAKDMDDYTRIISKISKEMAPLKLEDMISPKTFKREI